MRLRESSMRKSKKPKKRPEEKEEKPKNENAENTKINKYNFILTLIMTFLTVISLPSLIYDYFPYYQVSISYLPDKDPTLFFIQNIGNRVLTEVKSSYQIDCQLIETPLKFINKSVPNLALQPNPDYVHIEHFDSNTTFILKSAIDRKQICENVTGIAELPVSYFSPGFDMTINTYFCDPCNLRIHVISKEKKHQSFEYNFVMPLKTKLHLFCSDVMKSDITSFQLMKYCTFRYEHADESFITIRPRKVQLKCADESCLTTVLLISPSDE